MESESNQKMTQRRRVESLKTQKMHKCYETVGSEYAEGEEGGGKGIMIEMMIITGEKI